MYIYIYIYIYIYKIYYEVPLKKFAEAAIFISKLDCGMSTAIALYNMLAVSKLSYVATFFTPSVKVKRVERWALQKILCGPFNALPGGALFFRLLPKPSQCFEEF